MVSGLLRLPLMQSVSEKINEKKAAQKCLRIITIANRQNSIMNKDRINLYKEAMALEEKRAQLQEQLDEILANLSAIKDKLFDEDGYVRTQFGGAISVSRTSTGRTARGALKVQILRALTAAGSSGVKVKELAATLGVKSTNVHSWFQTSGKRIPVIKKIGEARYRLEGALSDAELAGPIPKTKNRTVRVTGKRSTRPLSGRGALAARIVEALKNAGEAGMTVRELADKLQVENYKNLFIWFSTTGRKNKAIKKIAKARYAFVE